MEYLIHKIFKFLNNNEIKYIENLIKKAKDLQNTKVIMNKIYLMILNKNIVIDYNKNRQNFISEKIYNYIFNDKLSFSKNTIKIVDIGGGNGNVLSNLNNILQINKENFLCIETQSDWIETYDFNNKNIKYLFWDNNTISIPDNSIDIVLCMVSLHHMSNDLINKVLLNIKRIMKKDGLLLIKEHDCNNNSVKKYIEWEHYLYHIQDILIEKKQLNIDEYFKNITHNFKNKYEWEQIIIKHNLKFYEKTNRFINGKYKKDIKNLSNLYWDIYKNIEL